MKSHVNKSMVTQQDGFIIKGWLTHWIEAQWLGGWEKRKGEKEVRKVLKNIC